MKLVKTLFLMKILAILYLATETHYHVIQDDNNRAGRNGNSPDHEMKDPHSIKGQ